MTNCSSSWIPSCREENHRHLVAELLPFWLDRALDKENGGFITHFDENGNDTGVDEKSLIAQTRCLYTFASAHRAGYGDGRAAALARAGFDFLQRNLRDRQHGGYHWMVKRDGTVIQPAKVGYGHCFVIYALSEYTLATGDPRGLEEATAVFDLMQRHAADPIHGGWFEFFNEDWSRAGPGPAGGDRKTLDFHMHWMEALTNLYEASGSAEHRRVLDETIALLDERIMHPVTGTGVPQFWADWSVAPQIKFDIVWGWDRFTEDGVKKEAEDNTSYGHNLEYFWLRQHALHQLGIRDDARQSRVRLAVDHAVKHGIDREYGGIFVEGSHEGSVYDREKEFWQQSEALVGLLDAVILWGDEPGGERYAEAYQQVHRFVHDTMINRAVGEWWPLMTRDGSPIWRHMGHSWKINYHTMRSMIQSIKRLDQLGQQIAHPE